MLNTKEYLEGQIRNAVGLFKAKVEEKLKRHAKYDEFNKKFGKLIDKIFAVNRDIKSESLKEVSNEALVVIGLTRPVVDFLINLLWDPGSGSVKGNEFNIGTLSVKLALLIDATPNIKSNERLKREMCHYLVYRLIIFLDAFHENTIQLNDLIKKITMRERGMDEHLKEIKKKYSENENGQSFWLSYTDEVIKGNSIIMGIPEYIEDPVENNRILVAGTDTNKFILSIGLEKEILSALIIKFKDSSNPKKGYSFGNYFQAD